MGKRIYIYRRGATGDCALTGAKDDPRLPSLAPPGRWHFWMQIGPLQSDHRECGFDTRALLDKRPVAPAEAAPQEEQTDA